MWLPVLLALSANSPFWQGRDTGYASFRSQAWTRFPTAGPTEIFGSAAAYEARAAGLVDTGVLLDRGMIYFDARLSHKYPTVEIRVADVCLHAEDSDRPRRPGPGAGRDGGPRRARRAAAAVRCRPT